MESKSHGIEEKEEQERNWASMSDLGFVCHDILFRWMVGCQNLQGEWLDKFKMYVNYYEQGL